MAFLTLNGLQIHVTASSARRRTKRTGKRSRSFRGQLRDASAFLRRGWSVEACLLDPDDALALQSLVYGEGHFVDFSDGLQASTSLMPEPGYPLGLTLNPTAYGAAGLGYLIVDETVEGTALAYDAQLGVDWTVIFWRVVDGTWVGHGVRSDGAAYRDGLAVDDYGVPFAEGGDGFYARVRDGIVELVKDGVADDVPIDDLTILPYRASDPMMEAFTSHSTGIKFGPCSAVRVAGDMIGEHPARVLAVGAVEDIEVIQQRSVRGIGWVNNAALVRFTLDEIDPRFVAALEIVDSGP